MRFEKLIIENFGPYKDKEIIDFTQNNGIIIIWGDNGRGKTTIMNAFNFLFFSTVKDNSGKIDDYFSFINELGKSEGNYRYSISLDVSMDNKHYKVTRALEIIHAGQVPHGNEDVVPVLSVNEDGNIVDKERAEHIIKKIMPEEVSRFFLFDGELLQQYEALLNEHSAEVVGIKKSIEQILGLPILTYGAADASRVQEKYASEANKAAQNDSNTQKYATQVERLNTGLNDHIKERDRLVDEKKAFVNRIARLKKDMEDTEKLRALYAKKDRINENIKEKKKALENEKNIITSLLKNAWTWMIVDCVHKERELLNQTIQTYQQKHDDAKKLNQTLHYIRQAVEVHKCPICEHEPTERELPILISKLNDIENGIIDLTSEEVEILTAAKNRSNALREFDHNDNDRNEIKRRCETINDLKVDIADLQDVELKEVNDDIIAVSKGNDLEDAVQKVVKELGDCEKELVIIEQGIENENTEIGQLKTSIEQLNKKIGSLSNNRNVIQANAKKNAVEAIYDIFKSAIDEYRDKLKNDVERNATDLFLAMSDEEDYGGLSINDNYGLSIIDKDTGEPIPHPSAGWEHMVAFSLIGALHQNAPFHGPIIMDFPFSRMSSIKRRPMMKAIPKMSDQVVLLVFPGEINPKYTRMDIGSSIVSEYTIGRVHGKHSRIERGGYDG